MTFELEKLVVNGNKYDENQLEAFRALPEKERKQAAIEIAKKYHDSLKHLRYEDLGDDSYKEVVAAALKKAEAQIAYIDTLFIENNLDLYLNLIKDLFKDNTASHLIKSIPIVVLKKKKKEYTDLVLKTQPGLLNLPSILFSPIEDNALFTDHLDSYQFFTEKLFEQSPGFIPHITEKMMPFLNMEKFFEQSPKLIPYINKEMMPFLNIEALLIDAEKKGNLTRLSPLLNTWLINNPTSYLNYLKVNINDPHQYLALIKQHVKPETINDYLTVEYLQTYPTHYYEIAKHFQIQSILSEQYLEKKADKIVLNTSQTTTSTQLSNLKRKSISVLTEEQFNEVASLIKTLNKEISSSWPYPNKDRKRIKVDGLRELITRANVAEESLEEIITAIKNKYPDMTKGTLSGKKKNSNRTSEVLESLQAKEQNPSP